MKIIYLKFTIGMLMLFGTSIGVSAQSFVDPYPIPQYGDGARAVLKNGEEVKGTCVCITGTPKNLKVVAIKDEAKVKHKWDPSEVERMYITLSKMRQFDKAMDASTVTTTKGFIRKTEEVNKMASIFNLSQNWDDMMNKNPEIVFDMVSEEEGKYGIRQLLNPGFDSKYRAYTWGQGFQSMGKSYPEMMLISSTGEQILTKVKNYPENFKKLFGDCEEFMSLFDPSLVEMEDLAFHLFLYTDMCKE